MVPLSAFIVDKLLAGPDDTAPPLPPWPPPSLPGQSPGQALWEPMRGSRFLVEPTLTSLLIARVQNDATTAFVDFVFKSVSGLTVTAPS